MTTMTDEEAFALGMRGVEAGARHAIGMSAITRDGRFGLIVGLGHDGARVLSQGVTTTRSRMDVAPDLRDPGTKGHAVAQLRERTGDSGFTTAYDEFRPGMAGEWWVSCRATLAALVDQNGPYPTEEEAIVAAFEATKETP